MGMLYETQPDLDVIECTHFDSWFTSNENEDDDNESIENFENFENASGSELNEMTFSVLQAWENSLGIEFFNCYGSNVEIDTIADVETVFDKAIVQVLEAGYGVFKGENFIEIFDKNESSTLSEDGEGSDKSPEVLLTKNETISLKTGIVQYVLPARLATYLINNDGFEGSEVEKNSIEQFLTENKLGNCLNVSEPYFAWSNDLTKLGDQVAVFDFEEIDGTEDAATISVKKIKTHFKITKRDETSDWRDDIVAKTGKIETVYVYDSLQCTNLAELEPSYRLEPLYYVTENEIDDETFDDMNECLSQETDTYIHCKELDKVIADFDIGEETHDCDDDIDYEAIFKDRIEYEQSNHRF